MTQESNQVFSGSAVATPPAARAAGEDLSRQIESTVEKRRGDVVRCSKVSGHHYRCNWWTQEPETTKPVGAIRDAVRDGSPLIQTNRIRRSRFLYVTRKEDGLVIEDVT